MRGHTRALSLAAVLAGGAAAFLWLELESATRPLAPMLPAGLRPAADAARASAPALSTPDAELARLRAENARLRAQLAAHEATRHETQEQLADALHELSELRRPMEIDMASSTLRAQLKPGEGVVTGGYRLPDGSRLFAFVETDARPGGDIGVLGRFFSVPDYDAQALGLGNLATEAANTLQHGEVWVREEMDAVTRQLGRSGQTRALGLGATALSPGSASSVRIPSQPPLAYRVYAERDAQDQLQLELRVESVPAP